MNVVAARHARELLKYTQIALEKTLKLILIPKYSNDNIMFNTQCKRRLFSNQHVFESCFLFELHAINLKNILAYVLNFVVFCVVVLSEHK